MKKEQVPQDAGMLDGEKELCYALDESGRYVQVQSSGWLPKNIALQQAWNQIDANLQQIRLQVQAGKLSPLAWHMVKNLMDEKLLAQYCGFSKRKIKKHLMPKYFERLDQNILKIYARLFKISINELKRIPD